jgi:hypothetical protein
MNSPNPLAPVTDQPKLPQSGLALASLILGIVSVFIPLGGVVLGIIAIVLAAIAYTEINKGKSSGKGMAIAGGILGLLGIFVTVAIYGLLFYYGFKADSGPFVELRDQGTQNMLAQNAGALELYKRKFGRYPEDLDELRKAGYTSYPADFAMRPLIYRVSPDGQSYELKGVGRDGKPDTSDDVVFKE